MTLTAVASAIVAALTAAGAAGAGSGVGLQVHALSTPAGTAVEVIAHVAPPGPVCAIAVARDGRPFRARTLRPKRSGAGVVRWRWAVPPPGGSFAIRVRCGAAGASRADIAVWSASGPT